SDQGHSDSLLYDRFDRWALHLRAARRLPAIHDLADQSLLPDLRGALSRAVHRRDHRAVHVLLHVGCLEGTEEGAPYRIGCPTEPHRHGDLVCDRRTDVLHEYASQGG